MRKGGAVYYLHGDHLGSTSLTTDATGGSVAQSRYLPYGQERWTDGPAQTDFTYTGQRADNFGLIDYTARYYDPYLNHWISPDSIVPQPENPQTLNRYSYANANPVKYRDPSGHDVGCPGRNASDCVFKPDEAQSPTEIVDNVEDDEYGTQGRLVDTWFEAHPDYDPYQDPNLWAPVKTDTGYILNVKGEYEWSVLNQYMWWRAGRGEGERIVEQSKQQTTAWVNSGGAALGFGALAFVPNRYGINGNPDHQATVARLQQMAEADFAGEDVDIRSSVSIKNFLGGIDRKPDKSVWDNNNQLLKVYEAGRVDQNGNFVSREQIKMSEYYEFGISYYFMEVK